MPKELTDDERENVIYSAVGMAMDGHRMGTALCRVREAWIAAFDAEAERLDRETDTCSQN